MALSGVEVLQERGAIDQDVLAARFATRMQYGRGYGQGTYAILEGIRGGRDWRALTQSRLPGDGLVRQRRRDASRTARRVLRGQRPGPGGRAGAPERRSDARACGGIAGAIAVAVAAALAWRSRDRGGPLGRDWINAIRDAVPAGYTRGAQRARRCRSKPAS